ncbi:MAG TPA: substrate-binding domain-containing protein [Bryobacteraceae bacterium]|nr:substrate-binding domain-containing protein [Bryobacteraceae bacterium]
MSEGHSVESVLRSCSIVRAFRYDGELLRLRDVVARTSLSKTTVHRLLRSLEAGGLTKRVGTETWACLVKPVESSRVRIGFASQTARSSFSQTVSDSIRRAAAANNVELLALDNKYSPKIALRNAEHLIRERVDAVLEFQTHEDVAALIAARFAEANIPLVAIEIPHPGAVFFGANNYQAGLMAGRALGKWAKTMWRGHVAEVLLLEERIAGPLPALRLTGALAGIKEAVGARDVDLPVTSYDARGSFEHAQHVVRQHLRRTPRQNVLVAATHDPVALGALRAFEEAGRLQSCAVASQNATREARDELRRPRSRLIGSVAYFPERYGDELIPLTLAIVAGRPTPPAIFVRHQLVTPANVDQLYPSDGHLNGFAAGGAGN